MVLHWHPGISGALVWENTEHGMQDLQKIQFFQVQQCKPSGTTQTSEVDTYSYKPELFALFFSNILLQRISECSHLVSKMNEDKSKNLKILHRTDILFSVQFENDSVLKCKVQMLLNLEALGRMWSEHKRLWKQRALFPEYFRRHRFSICTFWKSYLITPRKPWKGNYTVQC